MGRLNTKYYQDKGDRCEAGRGGPSKGELEAQGESAPRTCPSEVGLWGHSEARTRGGAHVPIIKLNNVEILRFM
jgi:hypothetical protein